MSIRPDRRLRARAGGTRHTVLVSPPSPTLNARQGCRCVRGPNHASRRIGSGRPRCRASAQVRRHEARVRVGGSRFLQTDPIEGGSANAYDYTGQDPINKEDLDGLWLAPLLRGIAVCIKVCLRAGRVIGRGAVVAGRAARAAGGWTGRLGYRELWGPNGRLFGGGEGNRKGWLNRSPVRGGWEWKGSRTEGHPTFRTGLGWPKSRQTNRFKRFIGNHHKGWF